MCSACSPTPGGRSWLVVAMVAPPGHPLLHAPPHHPSVLDFLFRGLGHGDWPAPERLLLEGPKWGSPKLSPQALSPFCSEPASAIAQMQRLSGPLMIPGFPQAGPGRLPSWTVEGRTLVSRFLWPWLALRGKGWGPAPRFSDPPVFLPPSPVRANHGAPCGEQVPPGPEDRERVLRRHLPG